MILELLLHIKKCFLSSFQLCIIYEKVIFAIVQFICKLLVQQIEAIFLQRNTSVQNDCLLIQLIGISILT